MTDWRLEGRRLSENLRLLLPAEVGFSSLADVEALTRLLSALCPEPEKVALGLSELLVNAVEHGNLGIGYQEKSRLHLEDRWHAEVARRLALPEYRERWATVRVERRQTEIVFTISDAGDGFPSQDYLETDPVRAFDPNGRGIALARQIGFSRIEYLGCGNVVIAAVALPPDYPWPSADTLPS